MGVGINGSGIIMMGGINKHYNETKTYLNTKMKLGIQLTKVLVRGKLKNSLSWCYSADVPFFFCWRHVPSMACVTANSCLNHLKNIYLCIFDSCVFAWKTGLRH